MDTQAKLMELANGLSTLAFILQAADTCSRIELNNTTNDQLTKKLQYKEKVKEQAHIIS